MAMLETISMRGALTLPMLLLWALLATGCGGGAGGSSVSGPVVGDDSSSGTSDPEPGTDPEPDPGDGTDELEQSLRNLIQERGLTGDPAARRGFQSRSDFPEEDPVARLGQLLFFSHSLSGGFDAACASCHHPDFANSDGLSLSVGVIPEHRNRVGPQRRVDHSRDQDPLADGGPNMHRNSQTIFNAALYDRALLYDGRVFVLDDETAQGGKGQSIRTPETANVGDLSGANGLLEAMVPFPMVNNNEMRGFVYPELANPVEYREHLMQRLRGEVDTEHLDPAAPPRDWLSRFQAAFGENAPANEVITMLNVQKAIAAYMETQIFVDTPWRAYVQGDQDRLSDTARKGAELFLKSPEQGGLGCASCHAGDRFTDERFYNVGFPQIGRGFRSAERDDTGRWRVTRKEKHWYAFRTPGLLNVGETPPYGHAGTFATLDGLLQYHAHPEQGVNDFFSSSDFLSHLDQFDTLSVQYDHAEEYTRKAINHSSFERSRDQLPNRALTTEEIEQLKAFLRSLTDSCVANASCISQWAPEASQDPDGHLLVRDEGTQAPPDGDTSDSLTPEPVNLQFPGLPVRVGFKELDDCTGENLLGEVTYNTGQKEFQRRTASDLFGLNAPHGFDYDTWFVGGNAVNTEATMIAGGVSAAYLDGDCWPDLIYAGGDASGIRLYENRGWQLGYDDVTNRLVEDPGTRFTGAAVADINGDYRREIFFGNLAQGDLVNEGVPIYALNADGNYTSIGKLDSPRPTYGISFGDVNGDGFPELYLAHWAGIGVDGSSPALWRNEAGTTLAPYDQQAGTSPASVSQKFNFTPLFADLTGNQRQDLLIASDFGTSQTLENLPGDDGDVAFRNVTDREVITDENGMGSLLADFFNRGRLDWFVTSVFDPDGEAEANWGVTGNRLYRNISDSTGYLAFENITDSTGDLRNGNWGWGACAADFNHDGFLDIFHVNGFGHIPEDIYPDGADQDRREQYRSLTTEFRGTTPRLLINNGDGTFTNRAADWGIDVPSEGRGVTCMDYDRDGDIDIALLDHSTGLQFFENRLGPWAGHRFLNVRLMGERPNTQALGARVYVDADVGGDFGVQQMMRVAHANSKFNSQDLPNLHFGLGAADTVDIRVKWPNGDELECPGVASNQFLVFDQRDNGGLGSCP